MTPLVVRHRLKLAGVSPSLLDEYRATRIDLDCLMLLAAIDDPGRQEELWSQLPDWARSADQLRRLIARGEADEETLLSHRSALDEALATFAPDWMAWAGCVVYVGAQGSAEVKRGLIRPEDGKAVDAARRVQPDDAGGSAASFVRQPQTTTRAVHSDRLMTRLTAHRVAATQAELMTPPDVALAAITWRLRRPGRRWTTRAPRGRGCCRRRPMLCCPGCWRRTATPCNGCLPSSLPAP